MAGAGPLLPVDLAAKVVGRYGGKYSTHMRDEGDNLIESVQEAIRIGEALTDEEIKGLEEHK